MGKRIASLILVIIVLMNLTGCAVKEKTRYEAEFLVFFDTVTKIVAYSESKEEFTEYAQLIYDTLEEYHQLYNIYDDYEGINNIKTINDNAGIQPVKVDQKIIDLLLFSKEAYELSDGMLNVAFGSVLRIWHDYRERGIDDPDNARVPAMEELEEAAKYTDINKVIIDEEASTVFLEDPHMSLDVGAIAKGYATEQVSDITYEAGYTDGLISVGGNVRARGEKGENHEYWSVGIQNPDMDAEESSLFVLNLKNLSMVTSGDYQRYYTVNGEIYHHIIDPDTLMPAAYFSAVTIICEDSGMADVLSTAIYNVPYEQGLKLIESLEDTEAVWIFRNGEVVFSSNFEKLIKE